MYFLLLPIMPLNCNNEEKMGWIKRKEGI